MCDTEFNFQFRYDNIINKDTNNSSADIKWGELLGKFKNMCVRL